MGDYDVETNGRIEYENRYPKVYDVRGRYLEHATVRYREPWEGLGMDIYDEDGQYMGSPDSITGEIIKPLRSMGR